MVYLAVGGADQVTAAIQAATASSGTQYSSLFTGTTVLGIISTAAWGLGYFGQPHILARFMAAENVKSLVNARRIGMTWMILCLLGAVMVGYFGSRLILARIPSKSTACRATPSGCLLR